MAWERADVEAVVSVRVEVINERSLVEMRTESE